jgi:hypothetical protein
LEVRDDLLCRQGKRQEGCRLDSEVGEAERFKFKATDGKMKIAADLHGTRKGEQMKAPESLGWDLCIQFLVVGLLPLCTPAHNADRSPAILVDSRPRLNVVRSGWAPGGREALSA